MELSPITSALREGRWVFMTGLSEATAAFAIQSKLGMEKKRGKETWRSTGRKPQQHRQVGDRKGVKAAGAGAWGVGLTKRVSVSSADLPFPITFSPNPR